MTKRVVVGALVCGGIISILLASHVRDAHGVPPPGAVAVNVPVVPCSSDVQCDDGFFCNGKERCHVAGAPADARGCSPGALPCTSGQVCQPDVGRCVVPCADADGDGHRAISCGGDDCDDADASRYPGNHEVCDPGGHDEDCEPRTYGTRDMDGDGEDDSRCCNSDAAGAWYCGTDLDDTRFEIRRGAQVCDGTNVFTNWGPQPCPKGTVCIPQPNGEGVCAAPPPGYTPPPAYVGPPPLDQRPPLPPPQVVKPRLGPNPPRPTGPRMALPPLTAPKK